MSSSRSGRARSDPTHQHPPHRHVHSHSAREPPHAPHPYSTMECESPERGGAVAPHPQSHHPHHPALQQQQSWSAAEMSQISEHNNNNNNNNGSHVHSAHSHTRPHRRSPPSSSGTISSHSAGGGGGGGGVATGFTQNVLIGSLYGDSGGGGGGGGGGGNYTNTRPNFGAPPQLSSASMAPDMTSIHPNPHHGPVGGGVVDGGASSIAGGGVNVQLPGYASHYGAPFPPQAWPTGAFSYGIPSTASGSGGIASRDGSQHGRSGGERGEESPMVGVCVQQSPVASH